MTFFFIILAVHDLLHSIPGIDRLQARCFGCDGMEECDDDGPASAE